MAEILGAGLGTPGLAWIAATAALAGLIYGFAGFGAALIFMPVATIFLPPAMAVGAISVMALSSVLTVLPAALRDCDRRGTAIMLTAALLATPPGIWVLRHADVTVLRWLISGIVALTLAALMTGWRYRQVPGPRSWLAVGGGVGFVGGATGLNGPVLVLFQLGGQDGIARIRANAIVVLTLQGLSMLPVLALQGALPPGAATTGALLFLPYGLGTLAGRWLFDPERVRLYRGAAYAIIGLAAVAGLPVPR